MRRFKTCVPTAEVQNCVHRIPGVKLKTTNTDHAVVADRSHNRTVKSCSLQPPLLAACSQQSLEYLHLFGYCVRNTAHRTLIFLSLTQKCIKFPWNIPRISQLCIYSGQQDRNVNVLQKKLWNPNKSAYAAHVLASE